jgi:hypothetical protein
MRDGIRRDQSAPNQSNRNTERSGARNGQVATDKYLDHQPVNARPLVRAYRLHKSANFQLAGVKGR